MPAGKTYVKIASQTLSGTSDTVTFSNLPQNYTDLIIVAGTPSVSTTSFIGMRFNSDSGSNYSSTRMYGDGSSATSDRYVNRTSALVGTVNSTSISTNIFHIMNYSNSATYKTILSRDSGTAIRVGALVSLWRNTSAITSISMIAPDSAGFTGGSTFILYGIECAKSPKAEGGDLIYSDGTYWYHRFNYSGQFVPRVALTADYLVVAGGGGGGFQGGGGGAGGMRCTVTATGGGGSLESALSLTGSTAYTVTIGAGGTSLVNGTVYPGSNSVFSTITSTGGGGGGSSNTSGGNGGSGGGAPSTGTASLTGGTGTINQGYAGGSYSNTSPYPSGGGGGAGAAGGNGSSSTAGSGGNGVATSISGSSVTYAGGGGGGIYGSGTAGTGGTGGGGNGTQGSSTPTAGTVNTGSGGGGGGAVAGGQGGSGIVIVRYAV